MRTLIIGYGNTLREDDGLGVEAVRLLRCAGLPGDVTLIDCQQLTPELSEPLAQAERAVFIDAACSRGEAAGTVYRQDLVGRSAETARMTHSFGPEDLLALAGALYGSQPAAALFTVTGGSFGFSETLTQPVQAAMLELVSTVAAWASQGVTHQRE